MRQPEAVPGGEAVSYPALAFDPPDRRLEATGDTPTKRRERARRAAQDVVKDRNANERAAVVALNKRLQTLKQDLAQRLLAAPGSLTDFQRVNLTALAADVDRMITDATAEIARGANGSYQDMVVLGQSSVDEPIEAAKLGLPALPGLDADLVTAAFDNTVDLLTLPMQQFASQVKVSLRRVALAGDNRFQAIVDLRQQIGGAGFESAQYKAERIIRTELGRVFNESTYARLLGMSKEFPFLRKGWRAANDGRTRLGHRQAARTYARGNGIPIADLFHVEVHNERAGKAPALIGTALLRFPIDPQAQPQGRIAAGATIMCRCNGFIDFDLADFAAYSAKQIQTALGGPLPAGPKPQPVPQPGPSARRRRAPRKQAAPPKLGNPKAVLPGGPTEGPLVSDALAPQGTLRSLHARAAKLIDQVHSDGILDKIPLKASAARRFYGQFKFYAFGRPVEIKMSKAGLAAHPINTLIHEVGHYIDAYAVGRNMPEGSFSWVQQRGAYATHIAGASTPMEGWRTAAKNSPTYQRLRAWRDAKPNERLAGGGGYEGDGTIPKGVVRKHLSYLTSTEETWARSYAQYVVVRSGDPEAMAELRRMQQGASYGPVSANTPFNTKPMGTDPTPNSWDYPVVWQDDEFEPIARAFDAIFEAMGWRKKS